MLRKTDVLSKLYLGYQIWNRTRSRSWTYVAPQRRRHVLLHLPPLLLKSFQKLSGFRAHLGSAVVGTCTGIEVTLIFLGEWSYRAAETLIHYTVMQFAKKIRGQSRVPFLIGYEIYPLLAVALCIVAISKKLSVFIPRPHRSLQFQRNTCSSASVDISFCSASIILIYSRVWSLFIDDLKEFRLLLCWWSLTVLISGNST